jgi:hypothetical protein
MCLRYGRPLVSALIRRNFIGKFGDRYLFAFVEFTLAIQPPLENCPLGKSFGLNTGPVKAGSEGGLPHERTLKILTTKKFYHEPPEHHELVV